jgi:hypothetical protein
LGELLQFRPVHHHVDDRELVGNDEVEPGISRFASGNALPGLIVVQVIIPLHVNSGDDLLRIQRGGEPQEQRNQYPPFE